MKGMFPFAAAAIGAAWLSPVLAQAPGPGMGSSVVILVRHGEKACTPPDDPPLSEAGTRRARALADALRDANVNLVITTEFRRTLETARPLASRLGIAPVSIRAGNNPDHVKQIVDAIDASAERTILVVGHTNTIPAIIDRIGGPKIEDMQEYSYSNMFVFYRDKDARLIWARYGDPDDPERRDCR